MIKINNHEIILLTEKALRRNRSALGTYLFGLAITN